MDQNSVVDFLNSKGMDSSPEGRASLYESNGLGSASDYTKAYNATQSGTGNNADLNTSLLNSLRGNNQMVTSSNSFRTTLNQGQTALQTALSSLQPPATPSTSGTSSTSTTDPNNPNYSDAFTRNLDQMSANADASSRNLINSIRATEMNSENDLNAHYTQYERGLETLGLASGAAKYTPEQLAGQIQTAKNEGQQKITDLQSKMNTALVQAQTAESNNDLKTVNDKMTYISQLKAAQTKALSDYYTQLNSGATFAKNNAPAWLDAINTPGLTPDQQHQVLESIANQYQIPLSEVASAVGNEKTTRNTTSLQNQREQQLIDKVISGTGSLADQKSAAIDKYTSNFVSGATLNGVPVIDNNGFLTPTAFKAAINDSEKYNLSRSDFIKAFGYLVYSPNASSYGLTPAETKLIT